MISLFSSRFQRNITYLKNNLFLKYFKFQFVCIQSASYFCYYVFSIYAFVYSCKPRILLFYLIFDTFLQLKPFHTFFLNMLHILLQRVRITSIYSLFISRISSASISFVMVLLQFLISRKVPISKQRIKELITVILELNFY